jgi:hypothetical protein
MSLRGNIPNIGFVASHLHISQAQDQEKVVEQVWLWSQSVNAENALQHACAIWVLVSSEYTWKAGTRAKFNYGYWRWGMRIRRNPDRLP